MKYTDAFMEANKHGKSPEETWANYMGAKAADMSWKKFLFDNWEREDILPPRGFIRDYKQYLTSTYKPITSINNQ